MRKLLGAAAVAVIVLGLTAVLASAGTRETVDGASVYYLNFKPEQSSQWNALAQAYTRETGVPVTVVTAASGTYEDALRAEMAKNEPPTLFQVNGPTGLRTWGSYCLDLRDTALYQNLRSDEFALKDGGKVLAVAYAIETYGLIYNKTLLEGYCSLENAVISHPSDIRNFETLRAVAEDIQSRREELGVLGAFTSAGMDASSDWRFKTHLANLPLWYEFRETGDTSSVRGTYLDNYRQIWDLYLNNATCAPGMIGARTGEDAASEFALGEAVFYQNGTWAYQDVIAEGLTDEDLGMLPIYIGAPGEEAQGLCTGSENYWCINRRAAPEDIEATKAFTEWVITSETGTKMLTEDMGFVTPFTSMESSVPVNALQQAAADDLSSGRMPVGWAFTAIPSEDWKNRVGSALLEYAQGTNGWEPVETAFTEGWI